MEIKNAVITQAILETNDRVGLTAVLVLDVGNSSVTFGCCALYTLKNGLNTANVAGHFIYKVLTVVGVDRWDKIVGTPVRFELNESGGVERIGHIIKDIWFNPDEDFAELRKDSAA